jgi:hypothetical protein
MKTPDQIRRQTVPVKHYALRFALLGLVGGAAVWFGGWRHFHQEQSRRYWEYCGAAFKSSIPSLHQDGHLSAAKLRYTLMRFGNVEHFYDGEIIRQGWYPRGTQFPVRWARENAGIEPLYSRSAPLVYAPPFLLTLLTCALGLIGGAVADRRYRHRLICGVPFDGSGVATVSEYNKETKGAGMRYAVKAWRDR